jgi:hypothetical protein
MKHPDFVPIAQSWLVLGWGIVDGACEEVSDEKKGSRDF